jgi:hypothetical protein
MKKTLVLLAISSVWFVAQSAFAATIPAGTTLVVRTTGPISSHEKVGNTFTAQLDQNVTVKGKVLLAAGTKVLGTIEASRANARSTSSSLTLNLTGVSTEGRMVAIKTVSGVQPQIPHTTARQSRTGVSAGKSTVPAGTKLEFKLAQPVSF